MTAKLRLPIDDVLPSLADALATGADVVLQAPTGAGKTTRVPPFLADQPWSRGKSIVILEPRRVAARAAAARIADERGVRLGGEVGYAVRFEQRTSKETRILACTEGVFLRRLQSDLFLEGVAAVVLDEFHERSVNADLVLALVRQVQREMRPELKIVVMSATLSPEPIADYLGDARILRSEGKLFPVDVEYAGPPGPPDLNRLPRFIRAAVGDLLRRTDGDLLVFLPGVGEIRRCEAALEDLASTQNLAMTPLYGDLPLEAQSAALNRGPRRKIVLATNVAETSVTIDGITGVVDSGLARVLKFDAGPGLDRLVLSRISKASAEQRKGRAGRTAPGVCVRLWTEREQSAMPDRDTPEIQRVDLAGPLLELHQWGESDPLGFPWFEPPPEPSVVRAEQLLHDLGAIDGTGKITPGGRRLAELPTHPRLARMIVEAAELNVLEEAAIAAALLGERDPFSQTRDRRPATTTAPSDVGVRVAAIQAFRDYGEQYSDAGELHASSGRSILRTADQLMRTTAGVMSRNAKAPPTELGLERAVFAAYSDRLARRRSPGSRQAVMVGGRGLVLAESSVVSDDELFVAVEIAPLAGSDDLMTSASAVRREWIPKSEIRTVEGAVFDQRQQKVVARRQTLYRDLVLDESPSASPDPAVIETVLAEAASKDLNSALDLNREDVGRFRARVAWLKETMPELELPALDDEQIRSLLPTLCSGRRSFAELREAPLASILEHSLTPAQRFALHREAPEKLEVPSGSKISIQYEPGKPPVLAVRIQELFGMVETPRIAGGRAPVLLHLLAPNYRAQQVTHDLRSFWTNVYPKIRKELRMKYPKHAWPEDPLTAAPVRKGPSQKR
jgi:ATP-dependent helicase HrpB